MSINEENSNEKIILIQSLIVIWFIFFSHFNVFAITQYSAVLKLVIISILPLIVMLLNISNNEIRLMKIDFYWISFSLIIFLGSLHSPVLSTGLFSSFKFFCLFLVFLFFARSKKWEYRMFNRFYIASFLYVLITIMHYFFPSLINSINDFLLPSNQSIVSNQLYDYGFYAGIAGQTGFNASIIIIFISITFSKLTVNSKSKFINLLLLLTGLVALFLTAKRGPLVGVIIAGIVVLIFLFVYKNRGNIVALFKFTFLFVTLATLVYTMTTYISALKLIFERFDQGESFFSNRDQIYENMLTNLNEFWFIGNGTASLSHILEVSGHNIYLQIFYENGVVGLLILLLFLGKIFIDTIKAILSSIKLELNEDLAMLVTSFFYQICFLIYGITESVLFNPTMFLPYLILTAMTYSLAINKKNDETNFKEHVKRSNP